MICVTSILGFLFKYILDVIISYAKYRYDQNYNITDIPENNNNITDVNINYDEINNIVFYHDKILFIFIIVIYAGSIIISTALYQCFRYVYEDDEIREDKENEDSKNCQIFGYIFYLKKIKNDKNTINKKKLPKNLFEINPEEEKETVTKVVLATEYKKEQTKRKKQKQIGKITLEFIRKNVIKFCLILKLLSDSLKSCFDEIVCNYFCCGKKIYVVVVFVLNVVNVDVVDVVSAVMNV